MFNDLTLRERTILEQHFGVGQTPKSLRQIAECFGVTTVRIRMVEIKALRKLSVEDRKIVSMRLGYDPVTGISLNQLKPKIEAATALRIVEEYPEAPESDSTVSSDTEVEVK